MSTETDGVFTSPTGCSKHERERKHLHLPDPERKEGSIS
jgi:hypothetical protein